MRRCSRIGCSAWAAATLTYAYASSTAVLGPLSGIRETGAYDLCAVHAERLHAPVGWEVIRLPMQEPEPSERFDDDELVALARAVREVGLAEHAPMPLVEPGKPHLRIVR